MLLRKGDIGAAVRELEKLLNAKGGKLKEDAVFDEATEAAVKDFQRSVGLVADGIAGERTMTALRVEINPRHLTQADIERAAAELDVTAAAIIAVTEVETKGTGFLKDGRVAILFERHVMYRQLAAMGRDVDLVNGNPAIVNSVRGGYQGGAAEYMRFAAACYIDRTSAIESASWGLFQIMGYHWQSLGYESAEAFVAAMQSGEGAQLDAFVRFVKLDPALHKALQARKWAEFAKIYNGSSYKENLYDVKLARAFERHSQEAVA
jgi:hypothetical protein